MDASYGVPFRAVSCRFVPLHYAPCSALPSGWRTPPQSKSQQLQSSVHSLPAAKPLAVIRYYE